jgi:LEM3 (ligand-effect modulator 3) family / CDC50 family
MNGAMHAQIDGPLKAGDTVTFKVVNNYLVSSFGGAKSLVLSHPSSLGTPNSYWPNSFLILGSLVSD